MNIFTFTDALKRLVPTAQWTLQGSPPTNETEYQQRMIWNNPAEAPTWAQVVANHYDKPTVITYEAFQSRFTTTEFNNASDFVYETDLTTGKPKRRTLIQGLSRAMAKNIVDLLDARTIAFIDALVAGGIITAQRKTEILTP